MKRFFTAIGSPFRKVRKPIVKEDGSIRVEVVGKEDFRAYINSNRDACDVALLVSRAVNGEPDLLNQRIGSYGDFTQMPKTYAEMLQKMIDAKDIFDALPADKKALFDNDLMKFISKVGEDDFFVKAGILERIEDVKESEEVKE